MKLLFGKFEWFSVSSPAADFEAHFLNEVGARSPKQGGNACLLALTYELMGWNTFQRRIINFVTLLLLLWHSIFNSQNKLSFSAHRAKCCNFNSDTTFENEKLFLFTKSNWNVSEMQHLGIWINFMCRFCVDWTFWYVVCDHLYNLKEGASYLTVLCFRIESLPTITKCEMLIAQAFQFSVLIDFLTSLIRV